MTAVSVRLVRHSDPVVPDLYGHVMRVNLWRVEWILIDDSTGQVIASGHALTKGSAWVDAHIAAFDRDVLARLPKGGGLR